MTILVLHSASSGQEQWTGSQELLKIFEILNGSAFTAGVVESTIGHHTFAHYTYEEVSGYLLINKAAPDVELCEQAISKMFAATYNELPNI
jgi:hypothetical protein